MSEPSYTTNGSIIYVCNEETDGVILGSSAEVLVGRSEACWIYTLKTLEWTEAQEALTVIYGTSVPNRFTLHSNMMCAKINVCLLI